MTIEARLRVADRSGDVLARETVRDEATVTIERAAGDPSQYGDVGGSGSLSIETG